MKIAEVRPISIGQFLFVRIATDEGINGLGESGVWGHLEASRAAIETFGRYLVGKDAQCIEHHWNVMHRFSYFQGAAINGAISAIDIALWDIKGKALGVPVHSLLGGPCRTKARVYGHAYGGTIDELVGNCVALRDAGFNAVGHINPFLDERAAQPYFKGHVRKMREAIQNVQRVRQAVGEDVDILLELHRRLTPGEAIVFADGIRSLHPMWCEDPVRPENLDSLAEVAEQMRLPIATGERIASLYEFQMLFARGGVHFARIDVCLCGGITGAKKIAAIAEAHNIQVAPHNPLSPVGLIACLHLASAIPNFAIQEFTTGFEAMQMTSSLKLLGADVVVGAPEAEQGFVPIPLDAGLGIDLAPDAEKRSRSTVREVGMRAHADGFVVDE